MCATESRLEGAGAGPLTLLADVRKVTIMLALRNGPLPATVVADRVGLSERRVRAHMSALSAEGLALRVRSDSLSRRPGWQLTESGHALLELQDLITHCELRLRRGTDGMRLQPLPRALRHGHVRAVVRALAAGSLTLAELERALEWIPRSTLGHDLRRLRESGLAQTQGAGAHRRHELRRQARGPLAVIAISTVRYRLRFWPHRPAWGVEDLFALITMLAPIVRVAPGVHGVCLMRVLADADDRTTDDCTLRRWPDPHVSVLRGRMTPLSQPSPRPPRAILRAGGFGWCEALLGGEREAIEIEGDERLAGALLAGIVAAMRVRAAQSSPAGRGTFES